MTHRPEIKKVAMIGCGSMGGGMALLLAEHDITVSLQDPSSETVDALLASAEKQGLAGKLEKHTDYRDLCTSLGSPKVFFFSLPHGTVGDTVAEGLHEFLEKGDVIIDASNENWENTQRRQGKLLAQGVYYVGMGVSGGYQAARRGPSMCPGGEEVAVNMILPMLRKVCAKDKMGRPCVGYVGAGGAGHYVKMIHNGIEHGMMSAVSEAWQIMNVCLGMKYDQIGEEFARWNKDGELRGTFLVDIGIQICQQRDKEGNHVLGEVQDKVVQDVDGTEGTGIWSNAEAVRLHVPSPSLTSSHYMRIASADRAQRIKAKKTVHGHYPQEKIVHSSEERKAFLEDLRLAVYEACLCSYIQGINIIEKADRENKWGINMSTVIQIWRAGCIIQWDFLADMLEDHFKQHAEDVNWNLLFEEQFGDELNKAFEPLKRVVTKGTAVNAVIPCLSATLEYMKYASNTVLPTSFYEAELDYFGKHMFDLKSEDAGLPQTGKHHFEWKLA